MLPLLLAACLACAAAGTPNDTTTQPPSPSTTTAKEILKASETGDPSKVEIVKQIRRLNDDGSYTIGYEADDGTFKIESRDVLGNVKGTFGYIDKDGEIKRVAYSSSSDPTPVPVSTTSTTTTTPSTPMMIVRVNKTVSSSSTTRRPLATVVYPTRTGHYTTRGTVVQPIPRRRFTTTTSTTKSSSETTTEKQQAEESTSNILNLYKPKTDEVMMRTRTQMQNPISATVKDDLITRQTTTKLPHTVKPVYEHVTEDPALDPGKANTIRRELTGTSNPHMISLQQSAGDDSTDVYGSHLSLGTVRPLFTTTTPRARLVPIHSLVAARQKIQQQYQDVSAQEQETTIEASTGRVFDHENVVTSNPVPVVQIAPRRPDDRLYHAQPIYSRPQASVHFRTHEYLRDNPGAPVPIGNQRAYLPYDHHKVLEPHYVRENSQPPQTKASAPEAATISPYDNRQVTRIIPIPVDERGVPLPGYQGFVSAFRPTPPPPQPMILQPPPRYDPIEEMNSISAPVSTRDLKRLLQILILRQNRLQALMDQIIAPGPPYQPLPLFRVASQQSQYVPQYSHQNRYQNRQYPDDERYDYRYEQQYRQQEAYQNQVAGFDDPPQYESQRYVPRRRLYTRPYDTASAASSRVEESPEYLPAEIREALLLKMLMLAISPDFMPTPAPATELTTAAPTRKQVRNVQILGEETSMDESKRDMQRH